MTRSLKPLYSHLSVLGAAVLLCVSLAACNEGTGGKRPAATLDTPQNQERTVYAVGNEQKFSVDTLRVEPDQKVDLQLINQATLPVMEHNIVVVQPGTATEVALAGLDAGPGENYVSPTDTNVVAATPVAAPGDTVSVSFNPPQPGTYGFICTFPGHYQRMHGVFIVNGDSATVAQKKPGSEDPGSVKGDKTEF